MKNTITVSYLLMHILKRCFLFCEVIEYYICFTEYLKNFDPSEVGVIFSLNNESSCNYFDLPAKICRF